MITSSGVGNPGPADQPSVVASPSPEGESESDRVEDGEDDDRGVKEANVITLPLAVVVVPQPFARRLPPLLPESEREMALPVEWW